MGMNPIYPRVNQPIKYKTVYILTKLLVKTALAEHITLFWPWSVWKNWECLLNLFLSHKELEQRFFVIKFYSKSFYINLTLGWPYFSTFWNPWWNHCLISHSLDFNNFSLILSYILGVLYMQESILAFSVFLKFYNFHISDGCEIKLNLWLLIDEHIQVNWYQFDAYQHKINESTPQTKLSQNWWEDK